VRVLYESRDGQRTALAISARGIPRAPEAPPPADANTIVGALQRIGLTDREIIVGFAGGQPGATEVTIVVPEKTPITRDGKPLKLEELKEGDRVAVRTEKRDGKLTALSLELGERGPAVAGKNPRIEKLRQFLKMADFLLQQVDENKGG
jgi:hypothetical protein